MCHHQSSTPILKGGGRGGGLESFEKGGTFVKGEQLENGDKTSCEAIHLQFTMETGLLHCDQASTRHVRTLPCVTNASTPEQINYKPIVCPQKMIAFSQMV